MSIVEEVPGYIQILSDGTVNRFTPEIASASDYEQDGFKSKDVIICPSKPITARLFLPPSPNTTPPPPIPLLFYFHGGGFCIGSTTWLGYHLFLGRLSASSNCLIVSVDYRLAPEHRLPTAYLDCLASLHWAASTPCPDPWLEAADLYRVFLSGDSAGANIAHSLSLALARDPLPGVRLTGVLPIHPYFGSERRTELETGGGDPAAMASNDMFWRLSVPLGSDRDYSGCNFEAAAEEGVQWREFPAVAVFVAGRDFLKERGEMYARFLKEKGVRNVRLFEAEAEPHVFHVFYPDSDATVLLQTQMSDFINSF